MIVKIQKPIIGSDCLIYNEDRMIKYATNDPAVFQLFEEEEYKIYHEATLEGTIIHIGNRVEDQDW